ncbi:hypothetical protein [Pseudobacteroides cellulosolvens]|uniref:Uncharacterized protein n=1 Tax=Pseudobacteroides cellulosolvens ATCC 35603 = DSM 2933 TaxID=398512 RepID=A0A0L6JXB5_9FIRM|nr:hypothetical protein [Pseudobacteroides cellulosolvens]KNY30087.1 hypothetical protein Bccel_5364 [Pseudobacteroides cellulosolvens ATCC 35603 = DSM 2933]
MKTNRALLLCILTILFVGLTFMNVASSAGKKSNYQDKNIDNPNYEASKEAINSETLQYVVKKGNRDSKDLKSIEQMEGYPSASDIQKANIKILKNELLPYEEFVEKYPEFGTQNNISPDRMVWVSKKHYPKGIITMRGNVKNAILITYYDAETGENIGYSTYSLDKDGMELEGPYKNQ